MTKNTESEEPPDNGLKGLEIEEIVMKAAENIRRKRENKILQKQIRQEKMHNHIMNAWVTSIISCGLTHKNWVDSIVGNERVITSVIIEEVFPKYVMPTTVEVVIRTMIIKGSEFLDGYPFMVDKKQVELYVGSFKRNV